MSAHPDWYVMAGLLRKIFDTSSKDEYQKALQRCGVTVGYARRLRNLHVFLSNGREKWIECGVSKCELVMQHVKFLEKNQLVVIPKASS